MEAILYVADKVEIIMALLLTFSRRSAFSHIWYLALLPTTFFPSLLLLPACLSAHWLCLTSEIHQLLILDQIHPNHHQRPSQNTGESVLEGPQFSQMQARLLPGHLRVHCTKLHAVRINDKSSQTAAVCHSESSRTRYESRINAQCHAFSPWS